MTDYSQGKIYAIKSYQTDDVYIGSTKETLEDRFDKHKYDYNYWLNGTFEYITSFEILKYDDAYIEKLEDYPCTSKKELERREGYYQRVINCVNKRIECRTKKEWIEDNKEHLKEYREEYYQNNKEKKKEYAKEWSENNKEKVKQYKKKWNEKNKEYQKEYRSRPEVKERQKNYLKEYDKEYRSRPEVQARNRQTFKCVCGKDIRRDNKRRHEKSKVHIKYIEDMKENGDIDNVTEFFEQFRFSYKST